jgi:hypothetical protein
MIFTLKKIIVYFIIFLISTSTNQYYYYTKLSCKIKMPLTLKNYESLLYVVVVQPNK